MNNINKIPYISSVVSLIVGLRHDRSHYNACKKWIKSVDHIFLDRIDLHCECVALTYDEISKAAPGEASSGIRERVIKARQFQEVRYRNVKGVHCNAQMTERMIDEFCRQGMDEDSLMLLRMGMEKLKLSARAYNRILKVARTIADLAESECIQS